MKIITKTLSSVIISGLAFSALATSIPAEQHSNTATLVTPTHTIEATPAERVETDATKLKEDASKLKEDVKDELHDVKVHDQNKMQEVKEDAKEKAHNVTETVKDAAHTVKEKTHNAIEATKEAVQPIAKPVKNAATKVVDKAKDMMHMDHVETVNGSADLVKVEKESLTVQGAANLKEVKVKHHLVVNGVANLLNSDLNDVKVNKIEVLGSLTAKSSQLDNVEVTAPSVDVESSKIDSLKISSNESVELKLTKKASVKKIEVIVHDKNAKVTVKLDEATNKTFSRGVIKANVPVEFKVEL